MTEQETGQWLECKANRDYEIWSEYPFQIRRKESKRICKESIDKSTGYIRCRLNGKAWYKHRIVAIQFIPNPNNLTDIDHINHIRSDNRLCNLRWTSRRDNIRNKSSHNGRQYTFLEQLPETAELLESYNDHEFNGLFVDYVQQKLYVFNGVYYRELEQVRINGKGTVGYNVFNVEGKRCRLCYNKLFTNIEEEED